MNLINADVLLTVLTELQQAYDKQSQHVVQDIIDTINDIPKINTNTIVEDIKKEYEYLYTDIVVTEKFMSQLP